MSVDRLVGTMRAAKALGEIAAHALKLIAPHQRPLPESASESFEKPPIIGVVRQLPIHECSHGGPWIEEWVKGAFASLERGVIKAHINSKIVAESWWFVLSADAVQVTLKFEVQVYTK